MSQTTDIIKRMWKKGSITNKEAVDEFGCYRLSGRIYDIRKMGINVQSEMVTVPRRDGSLARVARYTIKGEIPECFTA